jgi:hypothetical protein
MASAAQRNRHGGEIRGDAVKTVKPATEGRLRKENPACRAWKASPDRSSAALHSDKH